MLELTGFSSIQTGKVLEIFSLEREREDGMFSMCHASSEVLQLKNMAKY